jgi:hypothetical protein
MGKDQPDAGVCVDMHTDRSIGIVFPQQPAPTLHDRSIEAHLYRKIGIGIAG